MSTPRRGVATPDPQYTSTTVDSDPAGVTPQTNRIRIPTKNSDLEIYQASYSGVHVIEMTCRGVSVMRRRSDGALNATQILKVAGVQKGQRTKILEREIHTGPHDKVQGGYGKYQGTWIAYPIGLELCKRHGCRDLLAPLLDMDMTNMSLLDSTPTKEQHMASNRQTKQYNTQKSRQQAAAAAAAAFAETPKGQPTDASRDSSFRHGSGAATYAALIAASAQKPRRTSFDGPDRGNATVPTSGSPNPFAAAPEQQETDAAQIDHRMSQHKHARPAGAELNGIHSKRLEIPLLALSFPPLAIEDVAVADHSREVLTSVFLDSETYQATDELAEFPDDVHVDVAIDDLGHTALHWAAALARLSLVRALSRRSAEPRRGNADGETPIIRAVMVTNNSDQSSFMELLDSLGGSLATCDAQKRSILHHITLTSAIPGRSTACRYYLETLLEWIVRDGERFQMGLEAFSQTVVDARDRNGDTALNIAARLGNKALVNRLLEVGANPFIANRAGLRPIDSGVIDASTSDTDGKQLLQAVGLRNLSSNERTCTEVIDRTHTAIHGLLKSLQADFVKEQQQLETDGRVARTDLQTVAAELADLRRKSARAETQQQQLELVRQRIANTRRAIRTEQQEYEATAPNDDEISGSQENPSVNPDEILVPPDGSKASTHELKARIRAYAYNAGILNSLASSLRLKSSELEQRCRRVVALCTGEDDPSRIEHLLPQLLQAVESDGPATSEEAARIAGFLKIVQG
ncbi:transcriptional regulator swi6 [Savitreella phatthalungensis]